MNALAVHEEVKNVAAQARPVLRVRGLSKRYGTHLALKPVNLDLHAGQVHILFGENGAGKSTLISMIAGANQPTDGSLEIGTHTGGFTCVGEARRHGVRAVFQEFSLIPDLTVADNIVLGEEPVRAFGMLSKAAARSQVRELIAGLGFDLDADATVADLPRGKQQMVEICKAVRQNPKVLILDEPTASLSEHDTKALFALIERLKAQGTAIVYITHRMHEIPLIGDTLTVLRDGHLVASVAATTPESALIELMTGRTVSADIYPALRSDLGEVVLSLRGYTTRSREVVDASLQVRAGEIVGVAGLVGCGKSELGQACFGLHKIDAGELALNGQIHRFAHPADAIAAGLWYSPSDRKREGLALVRPASENMTLSSLAFGSARGAWLRRKAESSLLRHISSQVDFPVPRLGEAVGNFSGGNQQKALLAKGLAQNVNVYIFDEPTVGVDVGARQAIYKYLGELSAAGAAIVLISSDLPELLGLSHRLMVMRGGRIVREFARDQFDQHQVLEQFFD